MKIHPKFLLAFLIMASLMTYPIIGYSSYSDTLSSNSSDQLLGYNYSGAGLTLDTFNITNSTGATWTDFTIVVGAPEAYASGPNESFFLGYSGSGSAASASITAPYTSGPNSSIYPNEYNVTGISIASGSTYSFTVDVVAGEPGWSVYGSPSVGEGPPTVPEPCTILLLGSGLAGLAAYRRLKKA